MKIRLISAVNSGSFAAHEGSDRTRLRAGSPRSHRLFLFRARTTNGQRPVLDREASHAPKFGGVVRDERESKTTGVSGNEEIVRANHLATLLQVGADLRVVRRGTVAKLDNLDVRKERPQRREVLRSARRDFHDKWRKSPPRQHASADP